MDFVNPTALANRVDQNIIPEFAQGMEWIRARDALAQQHAQSSILARLEEMKRRQEVEDFDQAAPARTAERNSNIGMYGRKGELETAEQPHKIFTAGVKNSPAGREETVQQLINDPKHKREVEAAERLHGPMVTLDGMLKNGDIAGATRFWEETKAHLDASGYQLPQRFRNAPFEEIRPHIFRIYYIQYGPLDLSPDEAHYWEWSRRLDMSYYSKGPMIAYLIFFGTSLFGDTVFGVRILAVVFSALGSVFLYMLGKRKYDEQVGLYSAMLLQIIPLFAVFGVVFTIDSPFIFFWILSLCLF